MNTEWDGLSMDSLSSFAELVWRAQEQICKDTAACDGLGTFEDIGHILRGETTLSNMLRSNSGSEAGKVPFDRKAHRTMSGGRAFAIAYVDVFDSRPPKRRRQHGQPASSNLGHSPVPSRAIRSRILTRLDKDSGSVSHKTDGAGLSLRLVPRSHFVPSLYATAHFFQAGDGNIGTWWFSGSADLCCPSGMSPNAFWNDYSIFLRSLEGSSLGRHRREHERNLRQMRTTFLERCLCSGGTVLDEMSSSSDSNREDGGDGMSARDGKDEGGEIRQGIVSSSAGRVVEPGLDQITGFAFVSSVVDLLLPAYLPLVTRNRGGGGLKYLEGDILSKAPQQQGGRMGVARSERVALEGGAMVEATTLREVPYGLWRYNVQPSLLSAAGRYYQLLRQDGARFTGPGRQPTMYF